MGKISTTFFILLTVINLFSQSSTWTKDERNNLYDDCLGYLTKYKSTTQDQRESIALCYLDEITKKYSKSDFQSKIEIEIKRIKDGLITGCSKNLGVSLEIATEKKDIEIEKIEDVSTKKNIPTAEILIGRWKTDKGSTIEFKDGGKYSETNLKGKEYSGDWFLDGKVLTISLQEGRTQIITGKSTTKLTSQKYDFDFFSRDFIKYIKVGVAETIQANRIK